MHSAALLDSRKLTGERQPSVDGSPIIASYPRVLRDRFTETVCRCRLCRQTAPGPRNSVRSLWLSAIPPRPAPSSNSRISIRANRDLLPRVDRRCRDIKRPAQIERSRLIPLRFCSSVPPLSLLSPLTENFLIPGDASSVLIGGMLPTRNRD